MDDLILWFAGLGAAGQASIVSVVVSSVVAIIVALFNPIFAKRLERMKSDLDVGLERVKAELVKDQTENDARTAYEYEARKRLYHEFEPHLFNLFEAAEGSYFRVVSLVRTQRQGFLESQGGSWLAKDGYYAISTIYRLFLPLVIFRLLQRSANFVDVELDNRIRTRFYLLKLSYYALTDDFLLAELAPQLPYSPNVPDWKDRILSEPRRYCRQALVVGHLDRFIDALIVNEGGKSRAMNYGEFEAAYRTNSEFKGSVGEAIKLFINFSFREKPVLARVLLAHSYIMRLLLATFSPNMDKADLSSKLDDFVRSKEALEKLGWDDPDYQTMSESVVEYLKKGLVLIRHENYDI